MTKIKWGSLAIGEKTTAQLTERKERRFNQFPIIGSLLFNLGENAFDFVEISKLLFYLVKNVQGIYSF